MNEQTLPDLDVNGEIPRLAGKTCGAVLLQQYWHAGKLVDPANVIHLEFDGTWHRLYFDCGIVFWRISDEAPEAWVDPGHAWDYPLYDFGAEAGVLGDTLHHFTMAAIAGGCMIDFRFTGGVGLLFRNVDDHTTHGIG